MLIPIIKESEQKRKERYEWRHTPEGRGFLYDKLGEQTVDEVLLDAECVSSQLALLEGVKESCEGMMKDIRPEVTVWLSGNRETNESFNSALSQVIQSLEESITYLKSKI